MKQRPILFRTEMVKAILEGRKTQTRRVVKPQPEGKLLGWNSKSGVFEGTVSPIKCPYGQVGDVLWVRETWFHANYTGRYFFRADYSDEAHKHLQKSPARIYWKPSIHMPKAAARIWLKITDIRVEPLQDIQDEDAIKEGIEDTKLLESVPVPTWKCYTGLNPTGWWCAPVHSFETLWHSINGSDSWDSNPWVWVITFERINKPV